MPKPKLRERTIAFYTVKALRDGVVVPFADQIAWDSILETVNSTDLAMRTFEADRDLIGQPLRQQAAWNLLLHKVRDSSDWMSVADFKTGSIEEIEHQAGRGLLDTTVIRPAQFGNIIAVIEGSTSAPTHRGIELWLSKLDVLGTPVVVNPVSSPAEMDRLTQAGALQRIEITTDQPLPLDGKTGGLATMFRQARADYGDDVTVTITISAKRGKPRKGQQDARGRLYSDLREMEDVLPSAKRAKAGLLYAEDDYGRARLTELVEHNLTAKRRIPAVDEEGNSIKIAGAIAAMDSVIMEHEDVLRSIVGAEL